MMTPLLKPSRRGFRLSPKLLLCLLLPSAFCLLPSAFCLPLYVSLIDHLPPPDGGALESLDPAQRDAAFRAALQSATASGELPAATVIRPDAPVPGNATRVRVFLKQWSNTRHAGFTETDVRCRFFVEVVRDGQPVTRFGPYEGRTNLDPTAMTAPQSRGVVFQEAARRAIGEMARSLPR